MSTLEYSPHFFQNKKIPTRLFTHRDYWNCVYLLGKGKFLYSAVFSPRDCSVFYTLLPWQTCSYKHSLNFHRSHMLQLMQECYSYTYPPVSIAKYSFLSLSELEQYRVKKDAYGFNTAAQDSNPGSLSRESETLPLSH